MSYYSTSPGTRTTLLYSIELARLLIVRSLLLYAYGIAYCNRTFALMSITHPFGSDVKSMSEFYNKRFLRAVTLVSRRGTSDAIASLPVLFMSYPC